MSSSTGGPGFTEAGLEELRAVAERDVGDDAVPGLVALIAAGSDVHVLSLGTLSIGGDPVARDSLFRIASTTKPITAAATLAVIGEGLIALEEPVDRFLPELAERRVLRRIDGPLDETVSAARPITTRDLLTFTFGFGIVTEMFEAPHPWPVVSAEQELRLATLGPPNPAIQPDPDTWIANLGTLPLMAQPGERWMYNTGASVLGVLLARATGEPFPDVLRTRVFEPLGMRDTAFWTDDIERLATAYRPTPDGLVVWDQPAGMWSQAPRFADGAAGLVSTVDDLYAFARMLLGDGQPLLTSDAARAMTTDQLTESQKEHGGLRRNFFADRSWGYGQAVYSSGAFGWDGGLGSSWLVDPRRDLTMIVLTQRMFETSDPPPVHRELPAAAYRAIA